MQKLNKNLNYAYSGLMQGGSGLLMFLSARLHVGLSQGMMEVLVVWATGCAVVADGMWIQEKRQALMLEDNQVLL